MELSILLDLIKDGIWETVYMTVVSTFVAYLFGIPVGVILYVTSKGNIVENRIVNNIVGFITNMIRSVPFIILLVVLLPVTRLIVGTTIGSTASIVPLVAAAIPFVGRMIESSLKEIDEGVVEAAQSMGSSDMQIIWKVLLPEATPSILVGATIAIATILGYSAMAGFVGGGGLGALAINYGYYRYDTQIMLITVVLLIVIVQLFQVIGMKMAASKDKRIRK